MTDLESLSSAPLVSVIIPTYNRSQYLKTAIQSVLEQEYSHFEIIVSDDCSAENPEALVRSFQDSRIRFRRNEQNLGNGPNITAAFQESQGKYVASLNDDDYWHPQFLSTLVPPLETDSSLSLAFCDHYIVTADGAIDQALTDQNTKQWKRDELRAGIHQPFWEIGLVNQSVSPASSAVIRRSAVCWKELAEVGVYWDYYLTYLASRSGMGAYYHPQRLTYYRLHGQSETSLSGRTNPAAKIRKGKSGLFCYERFLADPQLKAHHAYFESKWVEASTTLGIGLLRSGKIREARHYLKQALGKQFTWRTFVALMLSWSPQPVTDRLIA